MPIREPTASPSSVSLEVPPSKNMCVLWRGMALNNIRVSPVHARLLWFLQDLRRLRYQITHLSPTLAETGPGNSDDDAMRCHKKT